MAEITERYADADQRELDGISVDYDDWHFNVRPSNTEPLLRLRLESLVSEEDMEASATRSCAYPLVIARQRPLPAIPTPFMVGRVNCYLIEDDPLTLVDSGRTRARRWTSSSARWTTSGTGSRTSQLIVITHQHIDHLGLVGDPRPPLGRRGLRARPARAADRELRATRPSATTSSPRR